VSKCHEETEQDPGEWERAAEWDKVREAENPAVWADPAQQGQQATVCARSAGKENHINADFPALSGNARSAGPQ